MLQDATAAAAFWGFMGAFIYAGPKLVACIVAAKEAKGSSLICALDAVVAMVSGAIAAAAFFQLVLTSFGLKDQNAISALIGLVANSYAPVLNAKSAAIVEAILGAVLPSKGGDK